YANVVEFAGDEDWQVVFVLFAATGADDSAEIPFGGAQRADQGAFGAVAFRTQHSYLGLGIAEGAQRRAGFGGRTRSTGKILSLGLEQGVDEECNFQGKLLILLLR